MSSRQSRIGNTSGAFTVGPFVCGFVVLVGWCISEFRGYVLSEAAPGELATVLFSSQASVVAIIFSLTYVGVQLTSPQYSPKLTWLFTQNSHLRLTFSALSLSLLLNSIVIVTSTDLPENFRLAVAAGMCVVTAITLYAIFEYALRALELATPAGIIAAYQDQVTPQSYTTRLRNTPSERRIDENPLRGMFEFLTAVHKNGPQSTWSNGVGVFTTRVGQIIEWVLRTEMDGSDRSIYLDQSSYRSLPMLQDEIDTTEDLFEHGGGNISCTPELKSMSDYSDLPGEDLFSPVAAEFLPSVAVDAIESDAQSESIKCIRQFYKLHLHGLRYGNSDAIGYSHVGIRKFLHQDLDSDNRSSKSSLLICWYLVIIELRQLSEFDTADHRRALSSELEEYQEVLASDEGTQWKSVDTLRPSLIKACSTILNSALTGQGDGFNADSRDIWDINLSTCDPNTAVIVSSFRLLCTVTELTMTDEVPVTRRARRLESSWKTVAQAATEYDTRLAITLHRGLIETGFVLTTSVEGRESDEMVRRWKGLISDLYDRSPEIVSEALNRIYPQTTDDRRRRTSSLPQPILRLDEFRPIREHEAAASVFSEFNPGTDDDTDSNNQQ